ncbi:hypothetical protein K432DRAFT_472054 [Lepidopterella palustris CBS 459.81]|uniref:Legume lectin domain-containing protein n=1 Tax=Lepidopterella palustris CBS 459.81 TaxID=1314670 RepID=A0A8E2J932_9PEZI|nr:hypothetical protein K432DRAFT_472054 [Lepidopterella palustris CBS 459.81]
MKPPPLLVSLPLLFLVFSQQTSAAVSSISSVGSSYHLRTHLKRRSCFNYHHFNGIYLYASPVDSLVGRNFALFTSNISLAANGSLSGTNPIDTIQGFYLGGVSTYGLHIFKDIDRGCLRLVAKRSGTVYAVH